uniref:Innexin n=1 Tax=Heterorhabditis bacteriophora TaxID=37862 RepID=A0A1I7XNQ4_HETBA
MIQLNLIKSKKDLRCEAIADLIKCPPGHDDGSGCIGLSPDSLGQNERDDHCGSKMVFQVLYHWMDNGKFTYCNRHFIDLRLRYVAFSNWMTVLVVLSRMYFNTQRFITVVILKGSPFLYASHYALPTYSGYYSG